MQTAGSIKVGAAFLAGIVVALGGALIYFKVSDVQVQTPVTAVSNARENLVSAVDVPPQKPAEVPPIVQPSQAPAVVKATVHVKARATSRPVSLAVSAYQREPLVEPVPAPAMELPLPDPGPMPASQPLAQPHTVTIPAGTTLAVRLNEKLSTEHNFSGDTFRAALDAPIVMDGFIIADRGAKVLGRVVKAQKPGKMQGLAELSLVLTEISTTDGQRMSVETNASLRKGPSNTNEEVVKMAGAAAIGAIIGAIAGGGRGAAIGAGAGGAAGTSAVLLGRGKPAVIESETRLTFELANSTTVTEHLN